MSIKHLSASFLTQTASVLMHSSNATSFFLQIDTVLSFADIHEHSVDFELVQRHLDRYCNDKMSGTSMPSTVLTS